MIAKSNANMESAPRQLDQMLPPARRPYQRVPPKRWDEMKDRIHGLFIKQNKTHEDVARILRESHGFDVGVRQLKRKTDAWEFTKNIPSEEMRRMIVKRRRRQDEFARPTTFTRRRGNGGFQEVSQERLDRYQRRFGPNHATSMSPSSGMPSNIQYFTPSSGNQNSQSAVACVSRHSDQITNEFNDSVDLIFNGLQDRFSHEADSPPLTISDTSAAPKLVISARELAYNGDYGLAEQKFKLASLAYHKTRGPHDWLTVVTEFEAALMQAAGFPGCPQELIARFAQELSQFLMREKQRYIHANPRERSLEGLRKTLTALKMNTDWASRLITQQRALRIWEPILGLEHLKLKVMRDNIARMRLRPTVSLDKEIWRIQKEDSLPAILQPNGLQLLGHISDMHQLCDGPSNELAEKFRVLETSNVENPKFKQEIALLRHSRSKALLGGYYSFLGRFNDAEKAFIESNQYMELETCVEIKLHRLLWHAEHKTRVQEWDGVRMLMVQAHTIFMSNDTPSEFVVAHFPCRFELLCKAVSKSVPIDKVVNEPLDDNAPEHPMSSHHNTEDRPPHPPPASSIMASVERIFPLSPGGFSSAIDIDAWRQFVHFPPATDSP